MPTISDVAQQVVNYEVFLEGTRRLGTASADLPELNYLTNEISGAGVAGKHEAPTLGHMENLQVTLHWRAIDGNSMAFFQGQQAAMLSLRGALQRYDAATGLRRVLPVRVDLRGFTVTNNLGKFEPSEQTETETQLNCDWVKISVDNVVVFEHDVFNFVHNVNGADALAEVRSALGV